MPTPIEEIKQRIDIVDFLSEYLRLTPGGANWRARCPFHNEKSPSFMVSRSKAIWHCFGCGKGGDIFAFLQEMEGLAFGEALRVLAKRANVTLEARDPQLASQRNKLLDIMREATLFAHQFLQKNEQALVARQYLAKRGVSQDTIELFQLGYMPPAWDTMKNHLLTLKFTEADIIAAGLALKRQQGTGSYDRFRGRVLFPIMDQHGNPIGFGGRIVESSAHPVAGSAGTDEVITEAKYINTPQTLIYDKSSVLFGIDRAKQAIKAAGVAVVVEGYMDCIASHQAGVPNVVASSGTALTEQQVRLLKRFAPTVVLSFDADNAGQEAAKRGLAQALQQELATKVLALPQGKDPDELIQKDVAAWQQAIADAKPALDYFFAAAETKHSPKTLDGKKALTKELLPLISYAHDPVEQNHYLKQLGELVGVDDKLLRERMPGARPVASSQGPVAGGKSGPAATPLTRESRVAERLIIGLLHAPDQFEYVAELVAPSSFPAGIPQDLYTAMLEWYSEHQSFSPEAFRASRSAREQQQLDVWLLLADREFPDPDPRALHRDITGMVTALQQYSLRMQLSALSQRIAELERTGQRGQIFEDTVRHFHELTDQLQKLQ